MRTARLHSLFFLFISSIELEDIKNPELLKKILMMICLQKAEDYVNCDCVIENWEKNIFFPSYFSHLLRFHFSFSFGLFSVKPLVASKCYFSLNYYFIVLNYRATIHHKVQNSRSPSYLNNLLCFSTFRVNPILFDCYDFRSSIFVSYEMFSGNSNITYR